MPERYPATFSFVNYEGQIPSLRNTLHKEEFTTSNRRLGLVDRHLSEAPPSVVINKAIVTLRRQVRVLDIGSGTLSAAANDIAQIYGRKVKIVGLDIAFEDPKTIGKQANNLQADALNLPLDQDSIDVIYSCQFLPYLDKKGSHKREVLLLKEIARVLAPGGVAILDEDHFSAKKQNSSEIRSLAISLGVDVLTIKAAEKNKRSLLLLSKQAPTA